MWVRDLDGVTAVDAKDKLCGRIASVRRGGCGVFEIYADEAGPVLCVHVAGDWVHLHYFPHADFLEHAGYRSVAAVLLPCPAEVAFQVFDADRARLEPLVVRRGSIVSEGEALAAARDFFDDPTRPPASVAWEEL